MRKGLFQVKMEVQLFVSVFFRPKGETPLPAMLYLHGGGYLMGVPELSLRIIKQYIKTRPCVIVAPDYRKGLQEGYPNGFNDCYDTLLWMKEHYRDLNISSPKFVVAGHSAGGGLTVAVSQKLVIEEKSILPFKCQFTL